MAVELFRKATSMAMSLPEQLGLTRQPTAARTVTVPAIAVIHPEDSPQMAAVRTVVDMAVSPALDRLAASEAARGAQHVQLVTAQTENQRLTKLNRIYLGAAIGTTLVALLAIRCAVANRSRS